MSFLCSIFWETSTKIRITFQCFLACSAMLRPAMGRASNVWGLYVQRPLKISSVTTLVSVEYLGFFFLCGFICNCIVRITFMWTPGIISVSWNRLSISWHKNQAYLFFFFPLSKYLIIFRVDILKIWFTPSPVSLKVHI